MNEFVVKNGLISQGNVTVTGSATTTLDSTINSITVGKGAGNIATNTVAGVGSLSNNTTGNFNSAFGYKSLLNNTTGRVNTAFGVNALASNTGGQKNNAFGYAALKFNVAGTFNNAFGGTSLYKNTIGIQNNAFGYGALYNNTVNNNNAFGFKALNNNTTGNLNSAFGHLALASNITGRVNSAFGYQALVSNTAGQKNVAVGVNAMQSNVIGNTNVAVGAASSGNNISGSSNNSFGYGALSANTTNNNNAFGYKALFANTTGNSNSAFGHLSLISNTTGNSNSAFGYKSLASNTVGRNNCAFGFQSLNFNTTDNNTAFGYSALAFNTVGTSNTAVGQSALKLNGSGSQNTAVGVNALSSNRTGGQNTAFGYNALSFNVLGNNNNIIGYKAGRSNVSGSQNNAFGFNALYANTTNYNNAFGHGVLQSNTTGTYNNAFGSFALGSNTIGNNNNAFGYRTLILNTTNNNNAFGYKSLNNNTIGYQNSAFGHLALASNTTGNGNTAFGYQSSATLAAQSSCSFFGANATSLVDGIVNSTAIGYGATVSASNQVVIGNTLITQTIINGSVSASSFTGSHSGTSSYALSASNAVSSQTASYLPIGTYNITSSWSNNSLTASSLVSANSYTITNLTASNISASGTVVINNLTTTGTTYLANNSYVTGSGNVVLNIYEAQAGFPAVIQYGNANGKSTIWQAGLNAYGNAFGDAFAFAVSSSGVQNTIKAYFSTAGNFNLLSGSLIFNGEATSNLYRSATGTIKTDGNFVVGGTTTTVNALSASGIVASNGITGGTTGGRNAVVATNDGTKLQTSFTLYQPGNATDQKYLELISLNSGSTLSLRTVNDAYTLSADIFRVNRTTSYFIDGITFPNGNITASGNISASGAVIASSFTGSFTGSISNATSASYALSASYAPGSSGLSGGTTNYIPLWTGANSQGISVISQSLNLISVSGSLFVSQDITSSNLNITNLASIRYLAINTGSVYGGITPLHVTDTQQTTQIIFQNRNVPAIGNATAVVLTNGATPFGAGTGLSTSSRDYRIINYYGSTTGSSDLYVDYWNGTAISKLLYLSASGNLAIGSGVDSNSPVVALVIGMQGAATGTTNGLRFSNDSVANLYRSATGTIKTDGNFVVGGTTTTINSLSASGINVSGTITATSFTGSLSGTSSWALSASYAPGSSGVTGGTTNYIPLWTSATTLSSSNVYQSASSVLVGMVTPNVTAPESLAVSGSTFNIISGYGSLNNYLQLNIKNSNSGSIGSSDIVATNNQGTETQYYVDLGINSSAHVAQGDVGQANDGYLYNTGSDFYIGNATPNKNLYLYAGSATNTSSVVLTSTNNVGIGTISPAYKLQVIGSFSATTKSFDIEHPTKSGKRLVYGSLESPYHGVRLTGRGKLIKGKGIIQLPDYMNSLVNYDDVNVQITNIKHNKTIYVDDIDEKNNIINIAAKVSKTQLNKELEFYWTFTAVRKDVPELTVEV